MLISARCARQVRPRAWPPKSRLTAPNIASTMFCCQYRPWSKQSRKTLRCRPRRHPFLVGATLHTPFVWSHSCTHSASKPLSMSVPSGMTGLLRIRYGTSRFSSRVGANAPREEFSTFHVDKSDLLYRSAGSATEYSREEMLARVASRIRCAIDGRDLACFVAGAGAL